MNQPLTAFFGDSLANRALSSLMFYRARYYNPSVGRFVSEDSMEFVALPSLYAYVGNTPTDHVDPSGLCPKGPDYDPSGWNDIDHVGTNNCYSYACNILHPKGPPHKPQPGDASGHNLTSDFKCLELKAAARAELPRLVPPGSNRPECPCSFHTSKCHRARILSELAPGGAQ